MKLAENLKTYRQKNRLTQSKLAKKLYVSRKTVSNWENGRSQPSFQTLNILSKLYGISVDNLLNGRIKKPSKTVLASYCLNIVLLISYYLIIIYHLNIVTYIKLLIPVNLFFLIINYKKWRYAVKNKLALVAILFISFISLMFNSWFYLEYAHNLTNIINKNIFYKMGAISGLISNIGLLTLSFFITLMLSKNIKFLFKIFKQ